MSSGKGGKPHSRIDSLIGVGTTVVGDIQFSGGIRIDGRVSGNVIGATDEITTATVSEHGAVDGQIKATNVVLNGVVVGPVSGIEYVELQPRATITGDVRYHSIEMQLGAVVDGRLIHEEGEAAQSKIVALKPPPSSEE